MKGRRSGSRSRHTALRDLLIVVGLAVAAYAAAEVFRLEPRLNAWLQANSEPVEAGELLIAVTALAIGLALFSFLRWIERTREAGRRAEIESRYRQLVERVPAVTYVWALDSVVGRDSAEFVSPQITEILGFTVDEWQADPDVWARQIHPDDLDRVMADWDQALVTKTPFRSEYRMFAKDGHLVWFRDEAVPTVVPNDGHTLLQGVMFDITDRRVVEDRLRHTEAQYRDLVERIPTITYLEEPGTGRFTYVSPQVGDILGYTPDEFLAPGLWRSRLHPDDAGRILSADEHTDETGEDFDAEYRILAKDGREVWVREHTELLHDETGRPTSWLGVMSDVTEEKHAQERVRHAERRYRKLIEQLPAVVYIDAADEQATALYMSPRYEELLGYTAEERLAQPDLWVRLLHPDDRDRVLAESNRTNETGEPFICEYRLIAKDGHVVWVRDEAYLVQDETATGDVNIWQGVLLDITEQKLAEENVRKREAILPAVGLAAQRFLKDPVWEHSVGEVFEHLGEAADVSRVYLFENRHTEDDDLVATQRFEWTAASARATHGGLNTEDWSYRATGFARWAQVLSSGGILTGLRSEFPETERALLVEEEIRSLLIVPVIVDGDWWGFLGFDECREDRAWTALEAEALKAAADILGTAIHRQLAERRLADTEAQFRALIEQLPAVTYVDTTSHPWRTTYVSPQLTTMLGYTQEEWQQIPSVWITALHPEDRDRVIAAVDEHNATGMPYEAEYRLRTKGGEWLWIRDQARMVHDEEGQQLSQGVMFDITSRREAEEHLRETEERFRVLVEHSPAMLYIETPDPTASSLYVSPQVADIFGVTQREYIDEPLTWERLIHPDDRDRAKAEYEGALAAARPWTIEYRVSRPDGREIWVRDECSLLTDESGRVVQVLGLVNDVTERKLAEQTLIESERREREAADRLRSLDDMKNTFLAAVSHELRSPLTSILGLALTLERTDQISDDDREDLLGRLASNARKLDRLLKDLLDIDRLSRGIVEPQYRLSDIAQLVRRTVDNLDLLADRNVVLETEPVLIPVDPAKVERIVENLVANAARHTSAEASIWVRVRPEDGGALILVEDDGPGIPDDILHAIFEPFRQGPNVSKANPGTGIGLSLVARFAELHGGRAWVDNRPGGGASFGVFLPGSPVPIGRGEDRVTDVGAA